MRRVRWQPLALVLFLATVPLPALAGDHLRVVLDTSTSMNTTDKQHLAILATLMLYDLAKLEVEQGDSFAIYPFDGAWNDKPPSWSEPSKPPSIGPVWRATAERQRFFNAFRSGYVSGYNAKQTYFYPGVEASVRELESSPGGAQAIRQIVLITDGVPTWPDWEQDLFAADLVPRMEKAGIRLDIMAVGKKATDQIAVLNGLLRASTTSVGRVFPDPNGDKMLETMIEIFSNSFGYIPDRQKIVHGRTPLPLENDQAPERVAVVAYWLQRSPPLVQLTAPPSASLNVDGPYEGRESGGSYALSWVLRPDRGSYTLTSSGTGGFGSSAPPVQLAVLRPGRLEIEVLPPGELHWALVGSERRIRVLIKPPAGRQGDPGRVDVKFRVVGPRQDPATGAVGFAWAGSNWESPVDNTGTPIAEGRVFELPVTFEREAEAGADVYGGHLEIEVRRRNAVVAALTGEAAHPVSVYEALALSPSPPRAAAVLQGASTTVLGRQQTGCAEFDLSLVKGRLPHAATPEYTLRVRLGPGVALDGPFHGARFTLDGLGLDVAGATATSDWGRGREVSGLDLTGRHQLCVGLDRPMAGDDTRPFEVPVTLTLMETPYEQADVIEPFTLLVRVPVPGPIEKWGSTILLALLAFGMVAAGWCLRGRPMLPDDLGFAIGHLDSDSGLVRYPLGPPKALRRWLFLVEERPLQAIGDQAPLGWIRPVRDNIYELRLSRGVEIDTEPPGGVTRRRRRRARIATQRTYRLRANQTTYLVRMEYR